MSFLSNQKREWSTPALQGTCSEMCPLAEIKERLTFNQLHVSNTFLDDTSREATYVLKELEKSLLDPNDTSLMVKRYFRTVTDETKQPHYLRNREGIAKSMDRLREVMDMEKIAFEIRASFVWDRYRAIWKDMSMQDWRDIFRVSVLEEMVRFLVFADYEVARLSAQANNFSYEDAYNTEYGIQMLLQCFVTLSDLYEDLRQCGEPCPNEFEFRVYHTLLQMTPVEGRQLEYDEIEAVFGYFSESITSFDGEKVAGLRYLYTSMKEVRWDQITDFIWQLDFFEFALARRILLRYRAVHFINFFKFLRRKDRLASHPPMALHEFCDRFFLTLEDGIKFAEAHGMQIVDDCSDEICVVINRGYQKPNQRMIPAVGVGQVSWGVITRGVLISDFVIQHPTAPCVANIDLRYPQMTWPSYVTAMKEWSGLIECYGMSGYDAAISQALYWQRYNNLDVLFKIPQETLIDENGTRHDCVMRLPHFRNVILFSFPIVPPEPIRKEETSVATDQVPMLIEEESKYEAGAESSKAKDEGETKIAESPVAVNAEADMKTILLPDQDIDEKPTCFIMQSTSSNVGDRQLLEKTPSTRVRRRNEPATTEIEEVAFIDRRDSETLTSSNTALRYVFRIDANECHAYDSEVEILIKGLPIVISHQVVFKQEQSPVYKKQSKDKVAKGPIACLSPYISFYKDTAVFIYAIRFRVQEEKRLPADAYEKFRQYAAIHGCGRNAQVLKQMELEFYEAYSERCAKIAAFEKTIPTGWKIHPMAKEELKDVTKPWMNPTIKPKSFPPRLTKDLLLKSFKKHSSTQISVVGEKNILRIAKSCRMASILANVILVQSGPLKKDDAAHVWLANRIFDDLERSEMTWKHEILSPHRVRLFTCQCRRVDLAAISDVDQEFIHQGSAVILLLDDLKKEDETLNKTVDLVQNAADKLPIIVLLASRPLDALIHENTFPKSAAGNARRSKQCEKIAKLLRPFVPHLRILDLTAHLEVVSRSIFKQISNAWEQHFPSQLRNDKRWSIKADTIEEQDFDPVHCGFDAIWESMIIRENPTSLSAEEHLGIDQMNLDDEDEKNDVKCCGTLAKAIKRPRETDIDRDRKIRS